MATRRWTLSDMTHLSIGKRSRLYHLLYKYGPANGTMMFLPYDQGLEHGPRDFFDNPASSDPGYILSLAKEGGFSAVAFQYGVSEKYMTEFAGEIPLILKLNGKTEIPADKQPLSCMISGVEDACRLGADAVGYTMYVGTGRQEEDFTIFQQVRREAESLGMPVVVWAYPRGEYVEAKGGKDSVYAIEYAARTAAELGSDVVKVNFPKKASPDKMAMMPKPYNEREFSDQEAIARVVEAAGKQFVVLSGGEKGNDADVLQKVQLSMEAGATGVIFGRNVWQRPKNEALSIVSKIRDVLIKHGR